MDRIKYKKGLASSFHPVHPPHPVKFPPKSSLCYHVRMQLTQSSLPSLLLHQAIVDGHYAEAQHLLYRGADPRQVTEQGLTAIHLAALWNRSDILAEISQLYKGDYAFRILLNEREKTGHSALYLAANGGCTEAVSVLSEAGANLNQKNGPFGFTALAIAVIHGHGKVVHLLLEKGADPNAKDYAQAGPLYWAAFTGKLTLVTPLLEAGALKEGVHGSKFETAHQVALRVGQRAIAELLAPPCIETPPPLAKTPLVETPLEYLERLLRYFNITTSAELSPPLLLEGGILTEKDLAILGVSLEIREDCLRLTLAPLRKELIQKIQAHFMECQKLLNYFISLEFYVMGAFTPLLSELRFLILSSPQAGWGEKALQVYSDFATVVLETYLRCKKEEILPLLQQRGVRALSEL